METTIKIPTSLDNVTVGQYLEYRAFADSPEGKIKSDLQKQTVSIFCNIPLAVAKGIKKKDVDSIYESIIQLFEEESEMSFKPIIKLDGKKYGFIPCLEDLEFGEFVDLDGFLGVEDKLHKVMSVLYRPVTKYKRLKSLFGGKPIYDIEAYEDTRYAEVMKGMPLANALGSLGFIMHLGEELLKHTADSLIAMNLPPEAQTHLVELQHLAKDGSGIFNFGLLHKMI